MDSDKPNPFSPQRISRFKNALVVHLVDFPIYYIECISERHFVIAGGGGSAKTGVHNQINVLELVPTDDACSASLVTKYHTPKEIPDAIMAGSLMRHLPISDTRLVTGGSCATIYTINFDPQKRNFKIPDYEILQDEQVEQDLKSVKCMPGRVITGGMTGQLALWNVNQESRSVEKVIRAHSKPIDEIDIDLQNQQVVTLSRDEGKCTIWSLPNLKTIAEFKKEFLNSPENNNIPNAKYYFRSCRYSANTISQSQQNSNESFLIVACNPIPSKGPSKLYKWKTTNYKKFDSASVQMEGIMAMTSSLDGKFIALGSRDGSVSVLDVINFRRIYSIDQAHHNAVTSLQFLDPKPESLHLTDSTCCALLSASIDRRVVLHRLKKGSFVRTLCKMLLVALILYLIFFSLLFKYN